MGAARRRRRSAGDSVPADWLVDELRQPDAVRVWGDVKAYIEAIRGAFRRDLWQDQPHYVERWGEKATVLGSMRRITHDHQVVLRVCRGFGSAGMEDQIGRCFESITTPITVFYIGDHDASGVLIGEEMHRRVQIAAGVDFEMKRLAINARDIADFSLPPQQIKETDARAKAFRRAYGSQTVELEALPLHELRRRVVDAIDGLIDPDLWDEQLAIQVAERASIAEFADRMKTIKTGEAS